MNSEKISKNEIVNKNLCDTAAMSNNCNNVDKSHSHGCDSGSTDSLTSDSGANGKFTTFEHFIKINMKCITIAETNISGNIDILLVSETKLDSSFPNAQFYMYGYTTPYRLDRNANGGGLLLYLRDDV